MGVEALSGGRKGRFRTMPPCTQAYPQKLIFQFLGVFLTVLSQLPPRKYQVSVDDSALTRDSGGSRFETGCRHQFLTIDFLFLTLLFPSHADFKLPPEKHFYFLPPNSGALLGPQCVSPRRAVCAKWAPLNSSTAVFKLNHDCHD